MKIVKEVPEKVFAKLHDRAYFSVIPDEKITDIMFVKEKETSSQYDVYISFNNGNRYLIGHLPHNLVAKYVNGKYNGFKNPEFSSGYFTDVDKEIMEQYIQHMCGCSCRAPSKKPVKKPITRKPAARKPARK